MKGGSQVTPELAEDDLQARMLVEHAVADEAAHLRLERLRLMHIVLGVGAGPADRGHRLPVGAAQMDRHRQPVPLGRRIDRPVEAPPERHVAHHQEQHLDEAAVGCQAHDLVHGELGVLRRQYDRGAKARLGVEPLLGDPVVDRPRRRRRQMLVHDLLDAVEAVEDGMALAPAAEELLGHRPRALGGPPVGAAPVRPRGQGRQRRIAPALEPLDAPDLDHLLPIVVEIGHQRPDARDLRVDVAVDRPGQAHGLVPGRYGRSLRHAFPLTP